MGLFSRDPRKKLQKNYEQKMAQAMQALRNGDVRRNAELTAEAEDIRREMETHAKLD